MCLNKNRARDNHKRNNLMLVQFPCIFKGFFITITKDYNCSNTEVRNFIASYKRIYTIRVLQISLNVSKI